MLPSPFKRGVCLSNFTTFRLGGPAMALCEAGSADEVMEAVRQASASGIGWRVIGLGSNLLVSDRGFGGAVIVFRERTPPSIGPDGTVRVSGGYPLSDLIGFMASSGLDSLSDLAGIPGTVGGAIAGNAGAYGRQIGDAVSSVLIMDGECRTRCVKPDELEFSYRSSRLRKGQEVVLEASFEATPADPALVSQRMEARLADRRRKHPDWRNVRTAGSYFRNPTAPDGGRTPAGRLLEEAGCRDLSVGGARTWPSHANIIVADEGARTEDVRSLAEMMSGRVEERFGISLVPEVVYLG
jgi:UDP-N-acetylmuramate dehydrogenase